VNFIDHKDLGNHLLQLCPKVVKHPVYFANIQKYQETTHINLLRLKILINTSFVHVLRRNCRLQRVIEGQIKGGIKVTGSRGRRRRKVLDDIKERRGHCHLKEEALDRTVWIAGFGRGFGPVIRQTAN